MADNAKLISARQAAQAVLNKAKEILENSSLMKSELAKGSKQIGWQHEKEHSKGVHPDITGTGRSYAGNKARQVSSLRGTPEISGVKAKEAHKKVLGEMKGMPKPNLPKSEDMTKYETENRKAPASVKYGKIENDQKALERDYDEYNVKPGNYKDSTGKRLTKQVSPSGNPKEFAEGNNPSDGMEPPYEFKDKVSKELAKQKAALGKAENPDKEEDAKLGEKVEHDVEEHMVNNADAERQEGHKIMDKPEDKKSEGAEGDKAFMPARLVGSAKLSKFCEYMHAKRKAKDASQAAGQQASDAPPARSHEDGRPNMEKKYEGFKAVEASAAKSGASDPAAVAAAAGRKKYGKEAFQHAASAGKKMGKK